MDQSSGELAQLTAHAREYVTRQRQQLRRHARSSARIDLASASTRDRSRVRAAADAMLGRRSIYATECHGCITPSCPRTSFSIASICVAGNARSGDRCDPRGASAILAASDQDSAPYVEQPSGARKTNGRRWTGRWTGAPALWRDGGQIARLARGRPEDCGPRREGLPLCWIQRAGRPDGFFSILRGRQERFPRTPGVTNVRGHRSSAPDRPRRLHIQGRWRDLLLDGEARRSSSTTRSSMRRSNPTAEETARC